MLKDVSSVEIHHPLQFVDLEKIRLVHNPSPYTEQPPLPKNSSDFSADIETETETVIETDIETDTNKLGKGSFNFKYKIGI